MTNLIPPDAIKAVKKEYWVRVLSVWAFLLTGTFVVFSALLVPTYVLFESQIKGFELEEAQTDKEPSEDYNQALDEITRANELAGQLSQETETFNASELLSAVEAAQSDAILINRFSYEREGETVNSIKLSGTAEDRNSLASFADALKRHPLFTEAEVPVSSLVREEDLPFNITVGVIKENK